MRYNFSYLVKMQYNVFSKMGYTVRHLGNDRMQTNSLLVETSSIDEKPSLIVT